MPPRPKGHQLEHADQNRQNDRADNLEWTTASENVKRSWRLTNRRNAPLRYLSAEVYAKVQELWDSGKYSQIQIGRMVGIGNSTVSRIVRGLIHCRKARQPAS